VRGRGCPRGIATTDPELEKQIDYLWGAQRITNLYASWQKQLKLLLYKLGLKDIKELRGRTDFLKHIDEK
jgi:glutamate synthase domain-containing protein 2